MEQEEYLEQNNITLDHIKINNKNTSAIYLNIRGKDFIGIDDSKINSNIEKRCIIQHEIAHFELGAVYTLYSGNSIEHSRIEYRANKRAINRLLPYSTLKEFILKNKPNYACEIADEFGITEDFVKKALEIYTIVS